MTASTTTRTPAQYRPATPVLVAGLITAATLAPLAIAGPFTPLGARGLIVAAALLITAVLAVVPNTWAWTSGTVTRRAAYVAVGFAVLSFALGLVVASAAVGGSQTVASAALFLLNWTLVPVGGFVLVTRYARMND